MENRSSLSNDLEKVFNTEKYSDITLSVGGKLFPAHKILLAARSDIFAAILMDQHKEEVIEIEDVTAEIMEEILRYIYTEKVERKDWLAKDLLIAADKYGLDGLQTICGKTLFKAVSVSNVLEMYKLARKNQADQLKHDVIRFMRENQIELMKTEAWRELQFDEQNFQMLKEIFEAFNQFRPNANINSAVSQGQSVNLESLNNNPITIISDSDISQQPSTARSPFVSRYSFLRRPGVSSFPTSRYNPYGTPQ